MECNVHTSCMYCRSFFVRSVGPREYQITVGNIPCPPLSLTLVDEKLIWYRCSTHITVFKVARSTNVGFASFHVMIDVPRKSIKHISVIAIHILIRQMILLSLSRMG